MALTEQQKEILSQISPADGFRYFAGDGENFLHPHAAIYAGSGKFHVVGVIASGEPALVECATIDDAVVEYKKLFKGRDIVAMALRQYRKKAALIGDAIETLEIMGDPEMMAALRQSKKELEEENIILLDWEQTKKELDLGK